MKYSLFTSFLHGSARIVGFLPKAKLHKYFCVGLALLMSSCTTTLPKETYLTSASLSGISRVAIVASANPPDVTYSSGTMSSSVMLAPVMAIPFIGLIGFLPSMVEDAAKSGIDTEHARQIGKRVDLTSIEDKITDVFSGSIVPAGCFKTVEQIKNKNQDEPLLSASGYDAIIRLTVREVSLNRKAGDYVGLHIHVQGQLKDLKSGQVLWDREETATSPESHQLDYYKENGLKEFNALLEKAGKKLAYDFVYLK